RSHRRISSFPTRRSSDLLKVLDGDSERLEVRHNSEWLNMSMEELLALARTTTAAQLLERQDFAQRWSAKRPISMLELLYPLLQRSEEHTSELQSPYDLVC